MNPTFAPQGMILSEIWLNAVNGFYSVVYLYLCRYLKNIANSTMCDTIAVLTVVHVTVVLNILCCCFIFCRCVLHAL